MKVVNDLTYNKNYLKLSVEYLKRENNLLTPNYRKSLI